MIGSGSKIWGYNSEDLLPVQGPASCIHPDPEFYMNGEVHALAAFNLMENFLQPSSRLVRTGFTHVVEVIRKYLLCRRIRCTKLYATFNTQREGGFCCMLHVRTDKFTPILNTDLYNNRKDVYTHRRNCCPERSSRLHCHSPVKKSEHVT
jgi:hypothetical protein